MEESKAAAVDLGEDSVWLSFKINGIEFQTEAFEASDLLAEIDRKHAGDPHSCTECNTAFTVPKELFGQTSKYTCPQCQSTKIAVSQVFLDDVKKMLAERFGAIRCARGEAARFYNAVVDATEAAKKNILIRQGLASGSIPTPENSAIPSGGLS